MGDKMIYLMRYRSLWVVRRLVRQLTRLIALVPGTTYGERSEMTDGPCPRCVGRAVTSPTEEVRTGGQAYAEAMARGDGK